MLHHTIYASHCTLCRSSAQPTLGERRIERMNQKNQQNWMQFSPDSWSNLAKNVSNQLMCIHNATHLFAVALFFCRLASNCQRSSFWPAAHWFVVCRRWCGDVDDISVFALLNAKNAHRKITSSFFHSFQRTFSSLRSEIRKHFWNVFLSISFRFFLEKRIMETWIGNMRAIEQFTRSFIFLAFPNESQLTEIENRFVSKTKKGLRF